MWIGECRDCAALRDILREITEDLAAEVEARYPLSSGDMPGRDVYPSMQLKYERDMEIVERARLYLRSKSVPTP